MEPFVLRAVRPVPRLGILVGDHVVFDPAAPSLVTRYRAKAVPNPGAVLLAYEEGALEPADSPTPPSVYELRQVVGFSRWSASSKLHAQLGRRRSLRVIR